MKKYNGEQIIQNAMIYGDNIKAYNDYLDLVAFLIKIIGLPRNAISEAIVLKELTKAGIFSKNRQLTIKNGIENDIVGFWGMHVINGIVSCRHIANFQSDVIKRNNLISDPFYCYITNNSFLNTGNFNVNHAINLIEYKGVYYGYDAINDKLFHFVSGMKMRELFSDEPAFAYYKSELKFVQNGLEIAEIKYDTDLFEAMIEAECIGKDEYDYIKINAKNAIDASSKVLDDFYESSKKYIKRITNGIK